MKEDIVGQTGIIGDVSIWNYAAIYKFSVCRNYVSFDWNYICIQTMYPAAIV